MAVHLTRIYTRTGDDGTTGLSDFSRVSKNDTRLVAYADCDEANAAIGAAIALGNPTSRYARYCDRSRTICSTPARICRRRWWRTPNIRRCASRSPTSTASRRGATSSTRGCRRSNPLCCPAVQRSRHCCTSPARWRDAPSVRRGTRSSRTPVSVSPLPAKYLNRLSDLLFILCRVVNPDGDVLWQPGGGSRPAEK